MKSFLKTLMRFLPIILMNLLGCSLAMDAKRPGEEIHVRIAPTSQPAVAQAQE